MTISHLSANTINSNSSQKAHENSWKNTAAKVGSRILNSLGTIGEFVTAPLRHLCNWSISYLNKDQPNVSTCAKNINHTQLEKMRKELRAFVKNDKAKTPVIINNKKINTQGIKKEFLKNGITKAEVDIFLQKFNDLLVKINHKATIYRCSSAEEITNDLEALLETKVYQTFRWTNSSTIRLLKQLSHATFYTDATGTMNNWGAQVNREQNQTKKSFEDFSTKLQETNQKTYYTHGALWVSLHSKNAIHAFESKHLQSSDAHQNNPSFVTQSTHAHDKVPPQKYGPTPTGYQRWLACLDYLNTKQQCEIMVCLKDTTGPEGAHQKILYSKTKAHRIVDKKLDYCADPTKPLYCLNAKKSLYFASIPYNMRSKKEIEQLLKNKNVQNANFEQEFMKILCQDHLSDGTQKIPTSIDSIQVCESKVRSENLNGKSNRFMIPQDLLSDAELKECYQLTADFFAHDPLAANATPEEQLQRALNMQRFLLNVIMTRFENNCMQHARDNRKTVASISSPCKQDFDRGGITKAIKNLLNEVIHSDTEQENEETKFSDQAINRSLTMATLRVNTYDYRKMDQGKITDGISLLNAISAIEKKLIEKKKSDTTSLTLQQELKTVFNISDV